MKWRSFVCFCIVVWERGMAGIASVTVPNRQVPKRLFTRYCRLLPLHSASWFLFLTSSHLFMFPALFSSTFHPLSCFVITPSLRQPYCLRLLPVHWPWTVMEVEQEYGSRCMVRVHDVSDFQSFASLLFSHASNVVSGTSVRGCLTRFAYAVFLSWATTGRQRRANLLMRLLTIEGRQNIFSTVPIQYIPFPTEGLKSEVSFTMEFWPFILFTSFFELKGDHINTIRVNLMEEVFYSLVLIGILCHFSEYV
jgi:hypothetical protein